MMNSLGKQYFRAFILGIELILNKYRSQIETLENVLMKNSILSYLSINEVFSEV